MTVVRFDICLWHPPSVIIKNDVISTRLSCNGQHLPETDQPTLLSAPTLQIYLQNVTCNSLEVLTARKFPLCLSRGGGGSFVRVKSCLFHDKSSARLAVIIFPDAMHTNSNHAITSLHCNVSIMLLLEITSQPPTPPQHTWTC